MWIWALINRHPTLDLFSIEEDWSYNPVSPVRTFQAKVAFVNVGPLPAIGIYFDD